MLEISIMKEFIKRNIFIIIIIFVVAGIYVYGKIQDDKKNEAICRDVLKLDNQQEALSTLSECKKNRNKYLWRLANKEASLKIDSYLYEANQIEELILKHSEEAVYINASEYIFLDMDKIQSRNRNKLLGKKVTITGSPRNCANPPWYNFVHIKPSHTICMRQEIYDGDTDIEHLDKMKIIIDNINDLNDKSKEIFDRSYNINFSFYDVTIFGEILNKKDNVFRHSRAYINADQIIFRIQDYTSKEIFSEIESDIRSTYRLKIEDYLRERKKIKK